jgi:mannitol-specific phosphotransferase system IIBC component
MDVGTRDIAIKIIQSAIVSILSFLVMSVIMRRNKLENNRAITNAYKNRVNGKRKRKKKRGEIENNKYFYFDRWCI